MEKHLCRICGKCFPTGRSLGGHMRSHIISYGDELSGKKKKTKKKKKKKLSEKLGGCSTTDYGLRENPKKLWRVSDLPDDDPTSTSSSSSLKWKQCRECSKVFPSSKSLFGHMRCHSTRICRQTEVKQQQGKEQQEEEDEEEGCWSGQKFSQESISDNNALYEQEQEEVAISLMMLSRDLTGCWASDSSDKHSMVFEEQQGDFEDSGFGKKTATFVVEEEKGDCFNNGYESKWGKTESKLEIGVYQCISCSRSFPSYQALGGHRASHMRIKPCCLQKPNSSFEGTTHELSSSLEVSRCCESSKSRVHKCNVCEKTFSSGQALGGHKRSHVAPNTAPATVKVPEMLDLNFPAPIDEEFSNVKPWRTCDRIGHEHQHLVNFISS